MIMANVIFKLTHKLLMTALESITQIRFYFRFLNNFNFAPKQLSVLCTKNMVEKSILATSDTYLYVKLYGLRKVLAHISPGSHYFGHYWRWPFFFWLLWRASPNYYELLFLVFILKIDPKKILRWWKPSTVIIMT